MVESTADEYFVLYVLHNLGDTVVKVPALVALGENGTTTLAENLQALPKERYVVEKFLISDPADIDGDRIDDITELQNPVSMNPMLANPVNPTSIDLTDGAMAIPDQETFEALSYQSYVKFIMTGVETGDPSIYFMNTNTHWRHSEFLQSVDIGNLTNWQIRGEIFFYPDKVAPDGSMGVYSFNLSPPNSWPFTVADLFHTMIAANMPLINDNLYYYVSLFNVGHYQYYAESFEESRVNVLFEDDLVADQTFIPLNNAEGYGLLRVMDPDERPNPRDVVIYETIPNDVPRVAGIITTAPQTPLSHVNLRANQDGVPNAFIRDALNNTSVTNLIDRYVHYAVGESDWNIYAATRAEVNAHHASSRPASEQIPLRDLSVTSIKPLSEVGFDDWKVFGVKATNVAVLGTLGFPEGTVPDGFAIPFYFYDEFMKHNGLYDRIESMLADPDFQTDIDTQESELKKLRKDIKKAETPEWIITELEEMHGEFPEGASLRYRSSTNNEDLPGFNGAGLYDSKTQHHDETVEDGIDKSLKQAYAGLWNLRAFAERDFHRVNHMMASMGVLVHPNYSDELANGVAVSFDPLSGNRNTYYVNTQIGEDLVTNPEALSRPEEIKLDKTRSRYVALVDLDPESAGGNAVYHVAIPRYTVISTSNHMPPWTLLMSNEQLDQLRKHLATIHNKFDDLYGVEQGEEFAMEIEFKITSEDILAIKQARPWVFETEHSPVAVNNPPTAKAGADQTVAEGSEVALSGTALDLDDFLLTQKWTHDSGLDISIADDTALSITFTAPEVDADTTVTFTLTVSDGDATGSDSVVLTIEDIPDTIVAAGAFVTTWNTAQPNESITIPVGGIGGTYTVDWGDGSTSTHTGDAAHTYPTAGTYTVSIYGDFTRISLGDDAANAAKLRSIGQWGDIRWTSMKAAFEGASSVTYSATDAPNLSSVTDMEDMFRDSSFNGDISPWDVSSVASMKGMFRDTPFDGDLSGWDVSSVTDMEDMFRDSSFNGDISPWDVSSVASMKGMFRDTPFDGDLSGWDVSSVTDMEDMFRDSSFNGDISPWDVSSVASMKGMFRDTPFDGDLSGWDVSPVTDMEDMFRDSSFNGDISPWDVSSVASMKGMFRDTPFDGDLSGWDVSSVTDMEDMFRGAITFNQPLSSWDISSVADMGDMFRDASAFEQNLGTWYIVLDGTSIDHDDAPGTVGSVSAQNSYLDNQNPVYGPGSGGDSGSFEINGSNLVLNAVPTKNTYAVTITSTGDFGSGNSRTLNIEISGFTNNSQPTVDAGADQTVMEGNSVTLAGTAADADGDAMTYTWAHDSALDIAFNGTSLTTTFEAPEVDEDTVVSFTLAVSDGVANSTDTVEITVRDGPDDSDFVTTWETGEPGESVTIPARGTYTVDWGDGTVNVGVSGIQTHAYGAAGNHTVRVSKGITGFHLDGHSDAGKLRSVDQWGDAEWASMRYSFKGASNMVLHAADVPDLSRVTDMRYMFKNAKSFDGDVSGWDVSGVADMSGMFWGASSFDGDVSGWDVSKVTDMNFMFDSAASFNQDLSGWDVSQVTDMGSMFTGATSFDQNLGNWYVVPADTAYATSEGTLNVTTVSAQNSILDGHSPNYGIGSGDDSALFNMTGSTLMFEATPSARDYTVNVTASGTSVFEGENNWRVLGIAVAGTDTDNTPPTITLNGPSAVTVTAGTTFDDPGATCTDNIDGTLTPVVTGTLDTDTSGTHTITYTCTDSSGNASTATRIVTVVAAEAPADTTDPVITINGSSGLTITAGTTYTEQGAICTDDTDPAPTVTTSGTVDTSNPGTYTVTYACTDSSGNGSTISRTVTVVDTTDPVITINGSSELTITAGTTYTEQGATCTDETDPAPTVTTSGTVDTSNPDTYTVTYTCTDSSGNPSTVTRIVTVVAAADTTPPTITISGDNPLTVTVGSTYTDDGATCTDETDGTLTPVVTGTVDTDRPGTYTITYTCTDSSDNASIATRTVTVIGMDAEPPEDNNPPEVDAGADQTVGEGDTVTLSGSAADPDAGDSVVSYSWSAPQGSGITFADGFSASTTFTAPAVDGDTTFTLTLTAGDGTDFGSDNVDVTVKETGSAFITTWRTAAAGEGITIPGTGTHDVVWGDGQFSGGASGGASHAYATPGTHTVSITGGLERINLGANSADAPKLQSIEQWGGIEWATMESTFRVATDMEYRATDAPDLSGVADMSNMFYRANSFDGDLSSWDVSQVTGMNSMFWGATSFNGNVSSWDVSRVTDMTNMFLAATSFNGDLSSWNVSSAIEMDNMFVGATSFDQNLGNWYVVPVDTAYATSEGTLNVTTVSAQNSFLDGHSPEYGIGSGGDSALFNMTGSTLMFEATPSARDYTVNVTASGTSVFEGKNNWRVLGIAVAGTDTDNTPPTITLNGPSAVTVTAGTTFDDPGATCTDNIDGTLTPVVTGTLDTDTSGTHTITYTCTDSSGNASTATRIVTVVAAEAPADTTDPVITINGSSGLTITAGTTYTEQGAICTDDTDPAPTVTTSGTVDTSNPDTYTVTYTCTDSSGNASTATRIVTVVAAETPADTTDPVITINGSSELTITAGTTYTEQGATCADDTDGSLQVTTSGTVDTSNPGTYTITYACTDSSGNGSTISRTVTVVDTTDPVITINGSSGLTITAGTTYTEQGATCTDETDPAPTVTTSGTVDTSNPDTYTITYTCTDSSGNASTATRIVTVVAAETPADTTDPVITINGSSELTITASTTYTEQGATCADDTDGSLQVTTSGTVDTSNPGTYTVTYACTDSSGNGSTISRTVTVVDTTDPVITINGSSGLTITAGTTYTEQGATCTDETDPAPTVTTSGTVDTSNPDTYTVTYTCTDSSGNPSTVTRIVTVVAAADTTPPDITLNDPSAVTVTAGAAFDDPGVTCTDETDPNPSIVSDIADIDVNIPGDYTITYTCTDSSGNASTATRIVTVVAAADTTPPTINISGDNPLTITVGSTYEDAGATCTDETDGTLTPTIAGTVDTDRPGTYTITYTCTDGSGNAAYDSRTVLVRAAEAADDTTPPRIDITGESRVRLHVGDAYAEQGATCTDDVDETREATIQKSTVDTSSAGSYIVIYECADSSGNASLKIRHVVVELPSENLPPVITLNGPSTVTVAAGSAFDDPGATCTDDKDGGLTVRVRGGDPDTSSAGTRHIHYSCTDSDGKTDSVVRTVIVV